MGWHLDLLFFAGAALVYIALSPLSIEGMGYSTETPAFIAYLLEKLGIVVAWPPPSGVWPRHGLLEVPFVAPLLALGSLFQVSPAVQDRLLALPPICASAATAALAFRWIRISGAGHRVAYGYAVTAAFCTLLWPYAYIGLETTQSLLVLTAGYLALSGNPGRWRRLSVAVACALAASAKSNGVFLLPAMCALAYFDARRGKLLGRGRPWLGLAFSLGFIALVSALAALIRTKGPTGGVLPAGFIVDEPGLYALHVISLIASANKGILIFAPIVLLAFSRFGATLRRFPAVGWYVLLVAGGLVTGHALFLYWSDETWGPRYLHSSVAPLVVSAALGAKKTGGWMRRLPATLLAGAGLLVSLLGISYYYGTLHWAAQQVSRANLEALQYDPSWNHPLFNARLLELQAGPPPTQDDPRVFWPRPVHWWWERPPGATDGQVDLSPRLHLQPLLLRSRGAQAAVLAALLAAGLALLALVAHSSLGTRKIHTVGDS